MSVELTLELRRQVDKGVSVLSRGGVIAFPTDTVYGLGASGRDFMAVERVYEVKERPRDMPLPLLLGAISQIGEVAGTVSPLAWRLAEKLLPGALTLVLPKSASVLDVITAGGHTVAVRVSAHPVPLALIDGLGAPLLGTSANLSGRPSALEAAEVYAQFGDGIDLVIDGGRCPGGLESTIVDLTGELPVVLREGAIALSELERAGGGIKFRKL